MLRVKPGVFILIAFFSFHANADMFGAVDSQQLIQLIELVRQANDTYEEVKDTADNIQNLAEIEAAKDVINYSRQFDELLSEIQRSEGLMDDLKEDKGMLGITRLRNRLRSIEQEYRKAGDKEGLARIRAYNASIKRLDFLVKTQEASASEVSSASRISQNDAGIATARSTALIAQILAEKQAAEGLNDTNSQREQIELRNAEKQLFNYSEVGELKQYGGDK